MSAPRRLVVTVDGRRHEVVVHPPRADGTVDVIVDGRVRRVVDGPDGDLLVRNEGDGEHVRVTLPKVGALSSAATPGQAHTLTVRTARQAARQDAEAAGATKAGNGATIEAPMPGRVVKVLVQEGQRVTADEALVIVEAMKMENEVRTPVAGRVARLSVQDGATVEPGQLLCTVEPEPEPEPDA